MGGIYVGLAALVPCVDLIPGRCPGLLYFGPSALRISAVVYRILS